MNGVWWTTHYINSTLNSTFSTSPHWHTVSLDTHETHKQSGHGIFPWNFKPTWGQPLKNCFKKRKNIHTCCISIWCNLIKCAMLHHQSMRCGYWKKQYIEGNTFPFISVSLPRSKLIKYSIQQLQSALVDWLWSAHPPHDEIIMCDSETLRHKTKNGNYFLEETTGRSGTSNIFPSNIYTT